MSGTRSEWTALALSMTGLLAAGIGLLLNESISPYVGASFLAFAALLGVLAAAWQARAAAPAT